MTLLNPVVKTIEVSTSSEGRVDVLFKKADGEVLADFQDTGSAFPAVLLYYQASEEVELADTIEFEDVKIEVWVNINHKEEGAEEAPASAPEMSAEEVEASDVIEAIDSNVEEVFIDLTTETVTFFRTYSNVNNLTEAEAFKISYEACLILCGLFRQAPEEQVPYYSRYTAEFTDGHEMFRAVTTFNKPADASKIPFYQAPPPVDNFLL